MVRFIYPKYILGIGESAPEETKLELETSTKTASVVKKPYIRKGYYPAKLLTVEPYNDESGNLKACNFGRMLIFSFAVYEGHPKTNAPLNPLVYKVEKEGEGVTEIEVVIPKFVYHMYKDKKTGNLQTAITPKSAITRLLKALGWEFSGKPVKIDDFIGKWVEVNIDDYEHTHNDEKYTASTVKDVSPYKGPAVEDKTEKPKAKKETATKEETVESKPESKEDKGGKEAKDKPDSTAEINKIKGTMEKLKGLHEDGLLSASGLKQALEQLEAKIIEVA